MIPDEAPPSPTPMRRSTGGSRWDIGATGRTVLRPGGQRRPWQWRLDRLGAHGDGNRWARLCHRPAGLRERLLATGGTGGARTPGAIDEIAPFLRPPLAEPEDRRRHIGQHPLSIGDEDRLVGAGRGIDPGHLPVIAAGALMERHFDQIVGHAAAPIDSGGEIGMVVVPAFEGDDVDLEEIGDVGPVGAEAAELIGLGGVGWGVAGRGVWGIPCYRRGIPCFGG